MVWVSGMQCVSGFNVQKLYPVNIQFVYNKKSAIKEILMAVACVHYTWPVCAYTSRFGGLAMDVHLTPEICPLMLLEPLLGRRRCTALCCTAIVSVKRR